MNDVSTTNRVQELRNEIALFVFIPFCKTVCTYCDFNVYAHLSRLYDAYASALIREIETAAWQIETPRLGKSLAFGGGTPSMLPAALIGRVVEAVHAQFELEPGSEVALEANPGTVDLAKLQTLRATGVNRLSLGVQTFDDRRLRQFNRNHNAADSLEAFELARRAGFDNINLDLIFGLPEQTTLEWEKELERAIALGAEHMSLYALQVEEGTALARQVARGGVTRPDPDMAAEMFVIAENMLEDAGYTHYEISNYSKPGFESAHNLTYWLNEPYIGFGAGAHSFFRRQRYWNVSAPEVYIDNLKLGKSTVDGLEEISRDLEIGETLMVGLRLKEGVGHARFRARFGVYVQELFGPTIQQLVEWGLMEADAKGIRLTQRGQLVSNQVLWRFLPERKDRADISKTVAV